MPNTGKPSKDCHLCRSRRVKCDLARPQCQRCIKYGVPCPGYRDQQDMLFRNAHPTAQKRRKQQQQQQQTLQQLQQLQEQLELEQVTRLDELAPSDITSLTIRSKNGSYVISPIAGPIGGFRHRIPEEEGIQQAEAMLKAVRSYSDTLPKSMALHWTVESVPILLNIYERLSFLYDTCRVNDREGPLLWAAHLFTRTFVTNVRYPTAKNKEALEETRQELGMYMSKALTSISQALQQPDGALRDDVLATIWILANYEILIGSLDRNGPTSTWHLHCEGLHGILKTRGPASLRTRKGRIAFWPSYSLLQIRALAASEETPPETTEWLEAMRESEETEDQMLVAGAVFIQEMSRIQKRLIYLMNNRDFELAAYEYWTLSAALDSAEIELEKYLAWWVQQVPRVDFYLFGLRDSALVKLHATLIQFINFLTHDPNCLIPKAEFIARRAMSISTCRRAADSILTMAPTVLDPLRKNIQKSPTMLFEAFKVLWPLISVFLISATTEEQKEKAEELLKFLGREIGIRQGLRNYDKKSSILPPEVEVAIGLPPIENIKWQPSKIQ